MEYTLGEYRPMNVVSAVWIAPNEVSRIIWHSVEYCFLCITWSRHWRIGAVLKNSVLSDTRIQPGVGQNGYELPPRLRLLTWPLCAAFPHLTVATSIYLKNVRCIIIIWTRWFNQENQGSQWVLTLFCAFNHNGFKWRNDMVDYLGKTWFSAYI